MKITLAAARVNAGLKSKDVAARLQIARQTLRNWEAGTQIPKPIYFDALCRLYGCTAEDIALPRDYGCTAEDIFLARDFTKSKKE